MPRININARTAASVFMWGGLISAILEGFKPAMATELFLWASINCFVWHDFRKGK